MVTRKTAPKPTPKRKNITVNRGSGEFTQATVESEEIGSAVRRGRPPKWTAVQLELVSNLCMLGLTNEELGRHLGIAGSTIEDWMFGRVKNPAEVSQFVHAIRTGREIADAKVAGSLYARAVGYEYDEEVAVPTGGGKVSLVTVRKKLPPDVAAAFIWLKNRRRRDWRDRHETEPQDPAAAAKVVQDAVAAALKTVDAAEGTGE